MSFPTYWMQSTIIPISVCDEVWRLCRKFIWCSTTNSKKCPVVSWSTISTPKEENGIECRSLRMVNVNYMMKLGWNMIINQDSLWV